MKKQTPELFHVKFTMTILITAACMLASCTKADQDITRMPPAPVPHVHFFTDSTNR